MSVDGDGTERGDGGDEPGWDVDPEDESGAAVVAAVGRQIKAWRESAGLRACEFGAAIGYGEDLVYKVEGGGRIPRPEFLDRADEVLGAGGKMAMMKRDVEEVRYPKKVRELAKWEAGPSRWGVQQPQHPRPVADRGVRPGLVRDAAARVLGGRGGTGLAARMARRHLRTDIRSCTEFRSGRGDPGRPIGGTMVLRRQLERLLE